MAQIEQRPNYCDFMTETRYAKCGNKFLRQIESLIDWRPINTYLNRKYTKIQNAVGHPAYPAPLMFKVLLGIWYGLSDEALEERINDSISFSRFRGISMDEKAPDHSTISRFNSTLVQLGIMEKLPDLSDKQLKKKNLLKVNSGVIVDASVVESPNTPSVIPDYEIADDRSDDCPSEEKEKGEAHRKYKLDNDGDSKARWVKKGRSPTTATKSMWPPISMAS